MTLPPLAIEWTWDQLWRVILAQLATLLWVGFIILLTIVALRLMRTVVSRIVLRTLENSPQGKREAQQKAKTLGEVIESTGRVIVLIVAGMTILASLGVNIAPLLASAGVVGIAIGLGAQSLIRDTINGFIILIENQYNIGDAVRINGMSGTVEEITLRRTVLRAINGAQLIIPNGDIRAVENQSKDWSRAVLDVETAANVDDERVLQLLHALLDNIQDDPAIGQAILEPPQILGISAITVTGVTFRILIKTQPMQQWQVERELRLRIRQKFAEEKIPVPSFTTPTLTGAPVTSPATPSEDDITEILT